MVGMLNEIESGLNIAEKHRNYLIVSSHQEGINTIVDVYNGGGTNLEDIKITIVEHQEYWWDDNPNNPTLEITYLPKGEKKSYSLCSNILNKSKANLSVNYNGLLGLKESLTYEIIVFSMIDQC